MSVAMVILKENELNLYNSLMDIPHIVLMIIKIRFLPQTTSKNNKQEKETKNRKAGSTARHPQGIRTIIDTMTLGGFIVEVYHHQSTP